MDRVDVYQQVTDKIIAALEAGTAPWRQGWNTKFPGGSAFPLSMSTDKPYRGANVIVLWAEAQDKGYSSPYWATFNQISKLGGSVRKGERGSPVIYWTFLKRVEKDSTGKEITKRIPLLRHYTVFNAGQADGLPKKFTTSTGAASTPFVPIQEAEKIARAYASFKGEAVLSPDAKGPLVSFGGDRACYYPVLDAVNLPSPEQFNSPEEFYATLFHELIHSTGHAKRLKRAGIDKPHFFGDPVYSREELVAELGAAFLCVLTGIQNVGLEKNSASYLAGWLKVLKEDKRAIVVAAGAAQKAADFVMGAGKKEDEEDASTEEG